ncbi:MAG: hypothetical protein V4696_01675 [Pseudomonadota bacterium]
MSEGWTIGDLALCVDASPARDLCGNGGMETKYVANLEHGRVYEVTSLVRCHCGEHMGLGNHAARAGGSIERFRKIKPDAHEDCEPEFVTLLQRIKRPVAA